MGATASCFTPQQNDASTDYHGASRLEKGQHERPQILINETAFNVDEELGAAGDREKLREMMSQGRREIRETQEKLNASLTTPVVGSDDSKEAEVLDRGNWLSELKDIKHRHSVLPPIAGGKKFSKAGTAFTID